MPTFDFRCKKCEAVFEHARPFGSKTNPACPSCKNRATEKLMSPPAVVFKGAGWYKTDSRKAALAPAKKTDDKPATAEAPKAPVTEARPPEPKTPRKGGKDSV